MRNRLMNGISGVIFAVIFNFIAESSDARYILIHLNSNQGSSRSLNVAGNRKFSAELTSRSGDKTVWKAAQKAFYDNVLGKFIRKEIFHIKPGPDKPGRAIMKCKAICKDRIACCNILVQPKNSGTYWLCFLYTGKFGGYSDPEIEEKSYPSGDKWSFYKENKYCHWSLGPGDDNNGNGNTPVTDIPDLNPTDNGNGNSPFTDIPDLNPTDNNGNGSNPVTDIPNPDKTTKSGNNDNTTPNPDPITTRGNTGGDDPHDKTTKGNDDGNGTDSNTDNPTNDGNTNSGQLTTSGLNPGPDKTTKGNGRPDVTTSAPKDPNQTPSTDAVVTTDGSENPITPPGPDKTTKGDVPPDFTTSAPKVPNQTTAKDNVVTTDGSENPINPGPLARRTCEFFCEDCKKRAGGTAYCGVCYQGSAGRFRMISVPSCCRECEVMPMASGKYQCKYCNKGSRRFYSG